MHSLSGHLMYVDSVYAKTFKEVAKLVSPMTMVPMTGCLSFQYQRSKESGNMFSVFTRDRLGQYQELWTVGTENQSDWQGTHGEWTLVQVDVKAPSSIQVSMNIACPTPAFLSLEIFLTQEEFKVLHRSQIKYHHVSGSSTGGL